MALALFTSLLYLPTPRILTAAKSQTSSITNYRRNLPEFPSLQLLIHKAPINTRALHPSPSSSASMEAPPEGYRRNVGICVINDSKNIFAASRLDIPNSWQMPQGGINEGEDPRVAALRELREETGIHSAELIAEIPDWLTYDFPPEVREKLKHQWGSDWKGQAQKWFLVKFNGSDEEINLLGDGTEKPEFGDWSWMSADQIVEQAVDFKKPVYEQVMKAFGPNLQ
ncbi:Nudix hydrolase [Quillaja saponaria]|uniref:Nudix hydrolase n=1 Tax=Quillaja saponaria TaxID=32244 RepID=A0AAD7Q4N6_QUISA|nr:Nudix hydrolase [Quillaja saponaria]